VKKLLLATTALTPFFLAVGSAGAADLPVKAPAPAPVAAPNWTGFYIGLNAGGAWGRADPNTSVTCAAAPGFTFPFIGFFGGCGGDVPLVNAAGTGSVTKAGFIGGGQAGYNAQSDNVVYGIELDFDSMNIKAARQVTGNYTTLPASFTVTTSANTNWLFTTRGRVGWAFGDVLAYATGGLAMTDLKSGNSFSDSATFFPGPGAGNWSTSATKLGWTAGAGIEWALSHNWSAKVEYLYVKFGSVTASGLVVGTTGTPPPGASYGNAINTSVDLTASIARAGINYKF
jgi:outer membrane immunogenic protein